MTASRWTCDECRYAENGWPHSLLKCELLQRPVKGSDECAVNTEALRRTVEAQEHLDDHLRLLREEHRQLGILEA